MFSACDELGNDQAFDGLGLSRQVDVGSEYGGDFVELGRLFKPLTHAVLSSKVICGIQ